MNSRIKFEAKINKLGEELRILREKDKALRLAQKKLRSENSVLRKNLKRIKESRDSWKDKLRLKQLEMKGLKARLSRQDKAKGHHYSVSVVQLCILLRIFGGCTYGSIVRVMKLLNSELNLGLKRIPCANTVQNWVSKMGLFHLKGVEKRLSGKAISLIIDESIRLGQEKLLLLLGVPFEKLMDKSLTFSDVEVLYMKGAKSWTGEKIATVVNDLKEKMGFDLKNILSDEDGKLKKASRELEVLHVSDISHAIGSCLRRVFKQSVDFEDFRKLLGTYSRKGVNQALSYLCPPNQRTKARFMNLRNPVNWAKKILEKFDCLEEKERLFFAQLPEHKKIISSLDKCLTEATKIGLLFKQKGICAKTLEEAKKILSNLDKRYRYMKPFSDEVTKYLSDYERIIEEFGNVTIHGSSDIIESMFGKFKRKANDYALTGLTSLNLELPIYGVSKSQISLGIISSLETISVLEIKEWKKDNSIDNQLVRRSEFFK